MQKVQVSPYFSREEKRALLKKNDVYAGLEILYHMMWIVGVFALVLFFPNVFTVIIALFILGGKQLSCAILLHDASHRAVFSNQRLNDWVGQWLGAYPLFQDLQQYRPYHQSHHYHNGLDEDPDLLLTRGYPTSKRSMIRKFTRDLTGQTGVKSLAGLILMNLGYIAYNLGGKLEKVPQENRSFFEFIKRFVSHLGKPILANVLIFAALFFAGSGWLYLLWIGAYLTTFQFSVRVRSMAEHSMVEDRRNPVLNTRTTYANFIERLLFAPYHVNYHAEHHMLMGVPSYNLPKMHKILLSKGFYNEAVLEKNYWNVIQLAIKQ